MPSMLETNHYYSARRFLLDGQREWALVIAGELLRSASGRELALSLLAEMYPGESKDQTSLAEDSSRELGGETTPAAVEQGVNTQGISGD
jgi:hypothetical protein